MIPLLVKLELLLFFLCTLKQRLLSTSSDLYQALTDLHLLKKNIILFNYLILQVAVVDVNDERGNNAQKAFEETYGAESTKFIKCDVSVESELKGCVTVK